MRPLKTLEKPDGRDWIPPAKGGIDIFSEFGDFRQRRLTDWY
jgi:hypothetical protein